ncbi:MAG: hypothetical protein ABSA84_01665 [Gammaproteobacteria bacterium]
MFNTVGLNIITILIILYHVLAFVIPIVFNGILIILGLRLFLGLISE